ncbi:fumarylacetoacetate hydrolase family protein [Leucobacter japonicus]|uniref:fumarylacetoacetate hydrolase family protein n=1 Tax=Leucobacter japonicus TaxID=1461259 RepID=UPI0006A7C292|nr:fumarylacetoacetate hydrolase family protein [Leucobacter japonicus]
MQIGNLAGRLVIITPEGAVDVAGASGNRFDSDPQRIYDRWSDFLSWAEHASLPEASPFEREALQAPAPRPAQVFAIGLNYREHADESGFEVPAAYPPVFTKFPSCITGPYREIRLPEGDVDWEVELVVVIGKPAWRISTEEGWDYVAGVTVGQDISERLLQFAMTPPQFSLGKSLPGFGPIGPVLVTPDELDDPDDLELSCSINEVVVQQGRTSQMIFSVGELIATLSSSVRLQPGDLVFTGTPSGVGIGRTPPLYLRDGDELVSTISGIGTLRNRFVRSAEAPASAADRKVS